MGCHGASGCTGFDEALNPKADKHKLWPSSHNKFTEVRFLFFLILEEVSLGPAL